MERELNYLSERIGQLEEKRSFFEGQAEQAEIDGRLKEISAKHVDELSEEIEILEGLLTITTEYSLK